MLYFILIFKVLSFSYALYYSIATFKSLLFAIISTFSKIFWKQDWKISWETSYIFRLSVVWSIFYLSTQLKGILS